MRALGMESRISEAVAADRVPGFAVALAEGSELSWAQGFGVTNVDAPLPFTCDTVFCAGSVSKPLIATAVLRLVELGELALDRAAHEYDPSLPEGVRGPTLRMLLSHTSGLGLEVDTDRTADLQTVVRDHAATAGAGRSPSSRPSYSNLGFAVAAHLAERATGLAFESLMQQLVFAPLDMCRTGFVAPTGEDVASPHELVDGALSTARHVQDGRGYVPARGVFSTVSDLTRFAIMQMNGGVFRGRRVLAPETLSAMHRLTARRPGRREAGFGLGLEVSDYKGVRVLGHTGDVGSYKTWLLFAPAERVAVVAGCNRPPLFRLMPLPWRILDQVLGLPEGWGPVADGRQRDDLARWRRRVERYLELDGQALPPSG